MDELSRLERALSVDPEDRAARRALVHALARCGKLYRARKVLRTRIASGRFQPADLELFLELGQRAGFVSSLTLLSSELLNLSALFHRRGAGATEVEVELGFAGPEGSGAAACVLALAELFGQAPTGIYSSGAFELEPGTSRAASSRPRRRRTDAIQSCVEFRLELREPWPVSERFRVRAIRVTSVPSDERRVLLRRKVLRNINAMAFIADARSDGSGESNEVVFTRLDREFSKLWGLPLRRFRLLLGYLEPIPLELHHALTLALQLEACPRVQANLSTDALSAPRHRRVLSNFRFGRDAVLAHEGILDAFALLLLRTMKDLAAVV